MEIKAQLNYLRIAPRKVRLVVDLVRKKEIKEAERQLKLLPQRSSVPIFKLLKSAIANAKSNFNVEKENLFIKNILVNEGVPYRRWIAMSRGRSYPIMKRTSSIILTLGVKEGVKIKKPDKTPQEAKIPAEALKSEALAVKPKRAPREIKKAKSSNWVKRIFRRKSM